MILFGKRVTVGACIRGGIRAEIESNRSAERSSVRVALRKRHGLYDPVALEDAVVVDKCDPRGDRAPYATQPRRGQSLTWFTNHTKTGNGPVGDVLFHEGRGRVGAVVVDDQTAPASSIERALSCERRERIREHRGVVVSADHDLECRRGSDVTQEPASAACRPGAGIARSRRASRQRRPKARRRAETVGRALDVARGLRDERSSRPDGC